MIRRSLVLVVSLLCLAGVVRLAQSVRQVPEPASAWSEVIPGLLRSAGSPAGYALVDGESALLIDAPFGADRAALQRRGVKKIELMLLTHHHRDTSARAGEWLAAGVPVRAAKESAEWLSLDGVKKYWQESLPLRNSRTAYLVLPVGVDGIDCSLKDNEVVTWRGWELRVVATPGHSRDHVNYLATKAGGEGQRSVLFAGDALASAGKLWSPYTTDWDHWTDLGLKPAAESLRKLAKLDPQVICPAHGEPILAAAAGVLSKTADAVAEVGFLKSFERFTKERLGDAPQYAFLAKEQAASGGEKPWSQLSPHLFLTGNTYVLVSKDNTLMVFDPWGQRSVDQVLKLQKDRQLGKIELVMFSHAHFDHYDGVYDLPGRENYQVWTLDEVAKPLAEPFFYRAPFLDARPVKIDRRFRDGDSAAWREYPFRFHHFPGQTHFTMAVETAIDGKKCLFTADNFFHQDQFSGSGGWMGLNRSWPLPYGASAQKVLEVRPDWVLAEHGGAFDFNETDFRRRVQWGEVGARAADALSPSGLHRRDWDPHRIHVEPLVHKARPGDTLHAELVIDNPLSMAERLSVTLEGRGVLADQTWELEVLPGKQARKPIELRVPLEIAAGRQVFALRAMSGTSVDPADAFVVIDVGR